MSSPAKPTPRPADEARLNTLIRRLHSEPDPLNTLQPAPSIGPPGRGIKRAPEEDNDPTCSNSDVPGAGSQMDSTLDRAKKLQEKNARAQKKYRQRQRVRPVAIAACAQCGWLTPVPVNDVGLPHRRSWMAWSRSPSSMRGRARTSASSSKP